MPRRDYVSLDFVLTKQEIAKFGYGNKYDNALAYRIQHHSTIFGPIKFQKYSYDIFIHAQTALTFTIIGAEDKTVIEIPGSSLREFSFPHPSGTIFSIYAQESEVIFYMGFKAHSKEAEALHSYGYPGSPNSLYSLPSRIHPDQMVVTYTKPEEHNKAIFFLTIPTRDRKSEYYFVYNKDGTLEIITHDMPASQKNLEKAMDYTSAFMIENYPSDEDDSFVVMMWMMLEWLDKQPTNKETNKIENEAVNEGTMNRLYDKMTERMCIIVKNVKNPELTGPIKEEIHKRERMMQYAKAHFPTLSLAPSNKKSTKSDNSKKAILKMCAVCHTTEGSLKKCSACLLIYYCSPEHQKVDWKRHKLSCKK